MTQTSTPKTTHCAFALIPHSGANHPAALGVLILLIVLGAGCTTRVKPTIQTTDALNIPAFTCPPTKVVNAQSSNEEVTIGRTGTGMGQIPKSVKANLHDWTGSAVEITKRELQKRTSADTGKAPKELRLSVTRIEVQPVVFLGGNQYNIRLSVQAGDGKERGFVSEYVDTHRSGIEQIGGAALAKAVATMLSDEGIRNYLRE